MSESGNTFRELDRTCLVQAAKGGDLSARESLIQWYQPFILRVSRWVCRRNVTLQEDEWSVALVAFNEAVDGYRAGRGTTFDSFATLVIRRRLIDYARRELRHRNVSLEPPAEGGHIGPAELRQARFEHSIRSSAFDLRIEIDRYRDILLHFDLDLESLIEATPKHRNTRHRLQYLASVLAQRADLFSQMKRTRRLPVQELQSLTGVNRKVLERGRRYVIAIALVLGGPFEGMQEYLEIQSGQD